MTDSAPNVRPATPKRENLLLNVVLSIAIPTLVLTRFSTDRWLGPTWGLLVALASPVGYFIYDYSVRRRANFITLIGMASVAATGGLGLTKAGGIWFAVKEAAVPLVIGIGMVSSTRSRRPLVRELLLNEEIVDVEKVGAKLAERGTAPAFDALVRRAGFGLAAGFLLSGALNFLLVRHILTAAPGTPAFNAELGRIHLLSWPIVVAPMLVICGVSLWAVFRGLRNLTGLGFDELMRDEAAKKEPEAAYSATSGQTDDDAVS